MAASRARDREPGPDPTSEHRVRVLRFFRHALEHVPVLDDLSVLIEAEDVHPCPVPISWPLLAAMEDDVFALRDGADEMHFLPRVLLRHPGEVGDEGILSVRNARIVLRVSIADVLLDGVRGAALVEG